MDRAFREKAHKEGHHPLRKKKAAMFVMTTSPPRKGSTRLVNSHRENLQKAKLVIENATTAKKKSLLPRGGYAKKKGKKTSRAVLRDFRSKKTSEGGKLKEIHADVKEKFSPKKGAALTNCVFKDQLRTFSQPKNQETTVQPR